MTYFWSFIYPNFVFSFWSEVSQGLDSSYVFLFYWNFLLLFNLKIFIKSKLLDVTIAIVPFNFMFEIKQSRCNKITQKKQNHITCIFSVKALKRFWLLDWTSSQNESLNERRKI